MDQILQSPLVNLGIYWWPNPDTKDGLPLVIRAWQGNEYKVYSHIVRGAAIQRERLIYGGVLLRKDG